MYTIKDVAKRAGVSVATVSRVLNGTETVREQTRRQVEEAIEALQYSPNGLGRNLRRLETKKILVVLSTISNQFHSRIVRGIEDRAMEEGYDVLIGTTRDRLETLQRYFEMIQTRQVDGAIFMSTHFSRPEELDFLKQDYPIVCACEPLPLPDGQVPYVGIDDEKAAREAVQYLISSGYKQIALIAAGAFLNGTLGSSSLREQGKRQVMEENGLAVSEDYILREGLSYNSGKRAAEKLLTMEPRPEAVFACSDAAAIGLIRELHTRGIQVPEDMAVIGFDNTAMSEVTYPSITTVAQPQYHIGQKAMDLLLQKIRGEEGEGSVFLTHEIIPRESTKNRN